MKHLFSTASLISIIVGFAMLSVTACGPGPYGYAKYYVASDAEEPFHEKAKDFPYGIVAADPAKYQDRPIAWFGVVKKLKHMDDGQYLVHLSHNSHRERHLCGGQSAKSCRVTVNFKETGNFSVYLRLRPADLEPGLEKIQPGTLMRVFARVKCHETDEDQVMCDYNDEGGLVLEGDYYRHWPAQHYVTTRAAGTLRR
jgi:hypothetical protein